MKTSLQQLQDFGQSPWYDNISRDIINNGELEKLRDLGVVGVTSNPSIFEKAIGTGNAYDEQIRELVTAGKNAGEIFTELSIRDIRNAADIFRPVYDRTNGADGYISIEVSPSLAKDTEGTLKEARYLFKTLDRPNIMVKVPATPEGIPAIETLIGEGINVNVTLIFALSAYEKVAGAYIAGLKKLEASGQKPLDKVASVASFFVSRVDTLVDKWLDEKIAATSDEKQKKELESLQGKAAIANAKLAYEKYKEIFGGAEFAPLKAKGAHPQRVLWASTSAKNPKYRDVLYAEELIGPNTVDTMPQQTIDALNDHGKIAPTLDTGYDEAHQVFERLEKAGISMEKATAQLLADGVKLFADAFDKMIGGVEGKRQKLAGEAGKKRRSFKMSLGQYQQKVDATLQKLTAQNFAEKVWKKDPSAWKDDQPTQEKILNRLGWLNVVQEMYNQLNDLTGLASQVQKEGYRNVVLLGMGGSSLGPEVFRRTFGKIPGSPELLVVDTTDPAFIIKTEKAVDVAKSIFVVSSKSGTTTEPNTFMAYYFDKVKQHKGAKAGENFIAITDPGTSLEKHGRENNFRRVFVNPPDIGGRYSVLSYFGLVPGVLAGYDIKTVLERALAMAEKTKTSTPQNPGLYLGAVMGTLAKEGRDKTTIIVPDEVSSYGLWAEQLIAESTGKEGRGVVPVAGEELGSPENYGNDRLFVALSLGGKDQHETKLKALEEAGHPVVRLEMKDLLDLGSEFFRWEFAIPVAGAVLGINPFDEPNVTESKDNTKRLLGEYSSQGKLPFPTPAAQTDGMILYGQKGSGEVKAYLANFFKQVKPGDYLAFMAYLTESPETDTALQKLRTAVQKKLKIATTVGYGPRFLHSTGQLHKGGANNGVFVQITADDPQDAPIPEEPFGFSILKQAQALGDFQSLETHERRAVSIHLKDSRKGLEQLAALFQEVLGK